MFVAVALGTAALDYGVVYRKIDKLLADEQIPASQFVMLYEKSRLLKGLVLGWSIAAASLAVWPVRSGAKNGNNAIHQVTELPN